MSQSAPLRPVLFGFFLTLGAAYGAGAVYFYAQESRAQSLSEARRAGASRLSHPEAVLGLIRERMAANDFSTEVKALVDRALAQAPSFYQPPTFLAAYHANRLEAPAATYRAFTGAIRRFPANGRLHLSFARWLLSAHSLLPGVPDPGAPERMRHLPEEGLEHLRIALSLEPDLTRAGLETLERHDVPPERWTELVPETEPARRQLIAALAESGHTEEALVHLRAWLEAAAGVRSYRQAAIWALAWGDPALALEAVERWKGAGAPREERRGIRPHEAGLLAARAHLRLGDAEAAYEVFRRTLNEVGPSTRSGVELLVAMGYEYLQLGRDALARSAFVEATGYAPGDARALLGLARAYRKAGKNAEALEAYRAALRVDPANEAALREIGGLSARAGSR